MDKENFYNDIKDTYKKYGLINRKLLKSEFKEYNVDYQLSKYGGLKNICKEIGIDYHYAAKISDADIIDDFRRVYMECGEISQKIYNEHGRYSSSAIKSHFGKINNLIKACGFKQKCSRFDSEEEVINDFLSFYKEFNSTSSTLYREHGAYSQSVIERLFGTWNDFITSLNLKPINHKVGCEKMIEDVVNLYNEYGFLSAKLIGDNCDFTYQALSYHYSIDEISKFCGCENAFAKRRSSGEETLESILCDIYGEENVISWYSEPWLINNKTGKRMYVDFYIPKEKLAIEYDGQQHFEFIEYFHRTFKNFFNQVCRDRLKERILRVHEIKIIRIKYTEKLSKESIKEILANI